MFDKSRVPPPGKGKHDPYLKDLDAVGFALDRLQTHIFWIEEHRLSFMATRESDPAWAEEELENLAQSAKHAQNHIIRLTELLLAGYTFDPAKRLPPNLMKRPSEPQWADSEEGK